MIHPTFRGIPDTPTAEALSQMLEVGDYRFSTRPTTVSEHEEFPPKNTEIINIIAAYLSNPEGTSFDRKIISLSDDMPAGGVMAGMYEELVGFYQSKTTYLSAVATAARTNGIGEITSLYANETRNKGKSLLAAYIIGRVHAGDNSRLIDAVAYPAGILEELPFTIRSSFLPILGKLKSFISEEIGDISERTAAEEVLANIVHGNQSSDDYVLTTACHILPGVDLVKGYLDSYYPAVPSSNG